MLSNHYIKPDWPAPANVHAVTTTRLGGYSLPPYDSFNLATYTGDDMAAVLKNREQLIAELALNSSPHWLDQVHSNKVIINPNFGTPEADAAVTDKKNVVCAILTADCLPILLCDVDSTKVAAIHAGWRGLAAGIIENTFEELGIVGKNLLAWLGPAISKNVFEVGEDVFSAFTKNQPEAKAAFSPSDFYQNKRWLDIKLIALQRLKKLGIMQVYNCNRCTYTEKQLFYSYRRDGKDTGRMASLIWLT